METRFTPEAQDMLRDLYLLDPRSFQEISLKGVPTGALDTLTKALQALRPDVVKSDLEKELFDLANSWSTIKLGRLEEFAVDEEFENEDDSDADEAPELESYISNVGSDDHREHCRNCAGCVYLLLIEYNMLTNAFPTIGLAYKYLLTLSVTQVACERSFSALKVIKTHMRSRLSQFRLEAFMLMKVECELMMSIDNDKIIDKLADHSDTYKKILKY